MFYAPNYFVGKGPMGRIWLAAHWDKKLTKQIIAEINILISIEQVFNNPELPPLALRLSGHLLVGITRIYSRKVKYLLADCSEALTKIKMAFRQSTQVDLPVEDSRASLKVINIRLPETIGDLDLALPELPEIDPLLLREDVFTIRAPEREFARPEQDILSATPYTEQMPPESPIFGAADEEEPKEEPRRDLHEPSSVHDLHERSGLGEEPAGMDVGPAPYEGGEEEPIYQPPTPTRETPPATPPAIPPTAETPPPVAAQKPPTQPKRKRALLDEDIIIEKKTFEAWLRSDDEITRELEVAPPTKKAAVQREWENASVDQLISMPNTSGLPEPLAVFFRNLLRPAEPVEPVLSGFHTPPPSPPPYAPGSPDERPFDDKFDVEDVAQVPYIDIEEDKSVEVARREADITAESSISEFINSEIQEALDESFFSLATRRIKARSAEQPKIDPKMEVALLFYQLLDCKNNNILELNQSTPYADIIATRA